LIASDAFRKALDDHRAGRLDRAAAGYAAILAADPDHLQATTNLAVLHYDGGCHADAVPLLETALRLNPDLAEARYILAAKPMARASSSPAPPRMHRKTPARAPAWRRWRWPPATSGGRWIMPSERSPWTVPTPTPETSRARR
jgi:tetratricopeptide (TPR) repeat protein